MLGRVAVVGPGAVGGYYGAKLARAGEEVHFLARTHLGRWRRHGMLVRSVDGDFLVRPARVHADAASIGPVDHAVIALKATANDRLAELVAPLVGAETRLLTLQNGLGNDDLLASVFGGWRVLGGLCFTCINRDAVGVIHHLGQGHISLGEYGRPAGGDSRLLAEAFKRAGVPARAHDSLEALQWRKLVWNVPFNGLTITLGGVDTGRLLDMPGAEPRVRALMAEVIAVGERLGQTFPESLIDDQVEVTRGMGAYRPSSLIDFLEGRPVEVEAIWGKAVAKAHELGVPVPTMDGLLTELQERVGG